MRRNALFFSMLTMLTMFALPTTALHGQENGFDTRREDSESFSAFLSMVQADEFPAAQVPIPESVTPQQEGAAEDVLDPVELLPEAIGSAEAVTPAQTASGEAERELPGRDPRMNKADVDPRDELKLTDVVASLYRSYPEILRAQQLLPMAGGQLLAAYGSYDTKFHAHSLSEPTGFYENYRSGLGVARQTWWGGYVSAGYRIGRGFYQPWYKERQTDDAGEFKLGMAQPLLQGRALDPQRVAVFQASLQQQAATPMVQETILAISRDAVSVYWDWVSAGAVLKAQEELLELAERRGRQFESGVKAGMFAEIDLILNRQLIAERRADLVKARQKLRVTSYKLALFLRNENGDPLVPADEWLPKRFPEIQTQSEFNFNTDLAAAISRRPEPQILEYELRHVQWDRRLATNDLLPRFDFVTEMSQDMGEPATKSDDKGEFELVIGFQSEVPIQRRKARGKLRETNAKIVGINEKIRLVRDKIAMDLRTAQANLVNSQQIVNQSAIALEAAFDTQRRYEKGFQKGYIDLIYLNILETKTNEVEIKLIEAQRDWFTALGEFQVALGLDPLDQAAIVSSLPPSNMPGPGNLPENKLPNDQAFERDWKLHEGQK